MSIVSSLEAEYRRYKALAEAALQQVGDEELAQTGPGDSNSLEMLIRHVAGNLASRFTDFRTSDGEKPWRDRDEEFETRSLTRAELMVQWERGWQALLTAIAGLTDADLGAEVTIRRQPLRIDEALHRSLAHTAYHVGQIVYVAKAMRAGAWQCLSIPRGGSKAHNAAGRPEHAAAHAAHLANVVEPRS
jgi:hypothetical protein